MARGRRVLVVDDDADSREALRLLIETFGHQVDVAATGEEAIRVTLDRKPEVVLLDIGMPGMDGYETARRIRSGPGGGRPYLIAVTGYTRLEDHRRTREAGCDVHLDKPFDDEELRLLLDVSPPPGPRSERYTGRRRVR